VVVCSPGAGAVASGHVDSARCVIFGSRAEEYFTGANAVLHRVGENDAHHCATVGKPDTRRIRNGRSAGAGPVVHRAVAPDTARPTPTSAPGASAPAPMPNCRNLKVESKTGLCDTRSRFPHSGSGLSAAPTALWAACIAARATLAK
jgi:hypothetical protein